MGILKILRIREIFIMINIRYTGFDLNIGEIGKSYKRFSEFTEYSGKQY